MLEAHLTELKELESKLKYLVEQDDTAQLKAVDAEHNRVWRALLAYPPNNRADCKKLAVFFIDRLLKQLERSPRNVRIRNRIVELFE